MSDIELDDADADAMSQHDPTLTEFRGTRGPHARLGWGRFEGRLGRPVDVDGDDRFASDACMPHGRFEFEGSTGEDGVLASIRQS